MEILYEDSDLIVCVKEPGVLSEDGNGMNMPDQIRSYLGKKDTYIGVVHRLDREAGGVMLFAKTPEAGARLSALISERKLEKTYIILIENPPEEDRGDYTDLLFHDRRKNKTYVVSRQRRGVREALLSFEVIRRFSFEGKRCAMLKIRIQTGRTHQIRVQFASRKMPLLGDRKYGSAFRFPAVALWCDSLTFPHPFSDKVVSLNAPLPRVSPWNLLDCTSES